MSQQLSSLVPELSLEDTVLDPDDMISMTIPREGESLRREGSTSPDSQSQSSIRSCTDNCCMEVEPTERGKLEVNVIPSSFHRSNSIQSSAMPAYPMMKQPRGLAIIINIETYDNDIQEQRMGSHVDVCNLAQLLKGLQFSVSIYHDLQLAEFYRVITEFCCNKTHADTDMAIVAILSHGKDGVVYAADGQSINMEYIYEFFNNRNCPALRGKPKFFIVQACRGDLPDTGVLHETEMSFPINPKKRRAAGTDTDALPTGLGVSDISRARPTWEDMIIAYSTIPGYASIRDHEKGTWFVQSLVEVFMNHSHDTELVDLLRMTSERLSQFTNEQGEKQTCNVEMRHLYKRIYFNPGLGKPGPVLTRSLSTPPASPQYTQDELWLRRINMKRSLPLLSLHFEAAKQPIREHVMTPNLQRNQRGPHPNVKLERRTKRMEWLRKIFKKQKSNSESRRGNSSEEKMEFN